MFAMIYFIAMNTNGQVFGHFSAFNGFNTNGFQRIAKIDEWLVAV
jgi:hypothetical protein